MHNILRTLIPAVFSLAICICQSKDDYIIDHVTMMYIMGRQGEYIGHISTLENADEMANKISGMIKDVGHSGGFLGTFFKDPTKLIAKPEKQTFRYTRTSLTRSICTGFPDQISEQQREYIVQQNFMKSENVVSRSELIFSRTPLYGNTFYEKS